MRNALRIVALVVVLLAAAHARAADRYFTMELGKLDITEGKLLVTTTVSHNYTLVEAMRPMVKVDGGGEGYVASANGEPGLATRWEDATWQSINIHRLTVAIRAPEGAGDITGRLAVPNDDWSAMITIPFKITAAQARADAKDTFTKAKLAYLSTLLNRPIAGAAYFRYQMRLAREEGGLSAEEAQNLNPGRWQPRRANDLSDTYALFSGGRAVAENLQLDRAFRRTTSQPTTEPSIAIAAIEGITVKPFDWAPIIKDMHPATDPLAALIPEDQHAIFFRSFTAFTDLLDQADHHSLPLLQLTEERSEDALTKERCQRQLGLSVTALGKVLGPQLISSVAITGSDAYLRMGSDLAILFESKSPDPASLRQLITAQITANTMSTPSLETGKLDFPWGSASNWTTPDRTVSSYVAVFGNTVVVTNSTAQLTALSAVLRKERKAISTTPEYTFFRQRYDRASGDETALLVLTDATIRRWCGPQVRIADARRTAALAVLTDLTAARMAHPGAAVDAPVTNPYPAVELGTLTQSATGVRSSIYNTIGFVTPIAELPITNVTLTEKQDYERWRDGYQRGFRQYFDPIAVQFTLDGKRIAADLTVMPLIEQTDYNSGSMPLRMTKGAALKPTSGDPHGALAHVVFAIDPKAPEFAQGANLLGPIMGKEGNPLAWLGDSIAFYADPDPFWADLTKSPDAQKFLEKEFPRLPVGLRIASNSPLRLAAFVTALHAYADQSAPNMVTWETRTHAGFSYVRIAPTADTAGENDALKQLAIYYVTTPDALLISLSEPLIKRSLERHAAATQPASQPAAAAAPATQPWLGQNVALHIDQAIVAALLHSTEKDMLAQQQALAWSNLPILNEIKRLYPKADAPQLYTQLWQIRLQDPAGGTYAWNQTFETYESTVFGCPAAPRKPSAAPAFLRDFQAADFGLTFEKDGLRARVLLHRAGPDTP